MQGYFWNTILAVNSCIWFVALGFLAYGTGMLIFGLDWKQFLLALTIFVVVSLTELVFTGLAHD